MELRKIPLLITLGAIAGCSSNYRARYDTDCHSSDVRERVGHVVAELSSKIGAPSRTGDGQFYIDIPLKPGEEPYRGFSAAPAGGEIYVNAYDGKITVAIARDGSGTDRLTEHVRKLVEEVLDDNQCGGWTFNDHVSKFDLK